MTVLVVAAILLIVAAVAAAVARVPRGVPGSRRADHAVAEAIGDATHDAAVADQPPSATPARTENGDVFAAYDRLPEQARCELLFAAETLVDERARALLYRGLSDPSEAVALAAARGLARTEERAVFERALEALPPERARRLRETLAVLEIE